MDLFPKANTVVNMTKFKSSLRTALLEAESENSQRALKEILATVQRAGVHKRDLNLALKEAMAKADKKEKKYWRKALWTLKKS